MLFLTSVLTQTITFLPLALSLYISFYVLCAIDMTLDGSFVLGAAVFARMLELGVTPTSAAIFAVFSGGMVGIGVSYIQRGQKINALLAGILAGFVLFSCNLVIMGRPNISLLAKVTLVTAAFSHGQTNGWLLVAFYSGVVCLLACVLLLTRFGLMLRALGDNYLLLYRRGGGVETYRFLGFALTNGLAAVSGCLTAQTIGYADIGMGYGVTLTALAAVILGKQIFANKIAQKGRNDLGAFGTCFIGVFSYFLVLNTLLYFEIDTIYLKMIFGVVLIFFLRMAHMNKIGSRA